MKKIYVLVLAVGLLHCAACDPAPRSQAPTGSCRIQPPADPAGPETVRVFAVGLRQDLATITTYAEFTAWIDEAIAAQAPCFASTVPNLVVLPEDTGLIAAFLGSRGAKARAQNESLGAFASLFTEYRTPLQYYRKRFPETPSIRMLLLALTDPLARSVETTFPVLAAKYKIYLAVSLNVADYERTEDAAVIAQVGDPDLKDQREAFIAKAPEVYNYSLVYGPGGEEIGRVRKAYLVPSEESLLQMNYGSLEQLRPIETPFGKLAPVISKDGWMPDVLERFNDLGADITLQHEAFSGWAIEENKGDWLPDVMQESFWNHVQAYDSFRYGVLPCLSGNLLDLVFDCQSAIAKEASPADVAMNWIGQPAGAGFLDIGAWVMPEPAGDLAERRAALRARGEAMLPGAGGDYENAYLQSVARGGLSLDRDANGLPLRGAVSQVSYGAAELPLGGSATVNAIRPDIAFDGAAYHVVWIEDSGAKRNIRYARLTSGETAAPAGVELPFIGKNFYSVRVAASGANVYAVAAYDQLTEKGSRLPLVVSTDGGLHWQSNPGVFAGTGAWARWNPAIAAEGDDVYISWTDRRSGSSDIYLAVSHDKGNSFATRRLDEDAADQDVRDDPANTRNNQALSSVSVLNGNVAVTWTDFRAYNWDIYAAWSTDAGAHWSANQRINQAITPGDGAERIFGVNAVVVTPGGGLVVVAEGVADRSRYHGVWQVFPHGLLAAGPAFRPHISAAGFTTFTVWQDLRNGDNDIYGIADGDDPTPVAIAKAPGQQFNPRSAGPAVVWEDWRSGRAQVVVGGFPSRYNPNVR